MADNKKPHTASTGTASKNTFDSGNLTTNLISKVKKIPAEVCSTCRHSETAKTVCVDGDNFNLFCWNLDAYVSPFTHCSEWEGE